MLSIVCWKWKSRDKHRQYTARYVNALRNMIADNLTLPHRLVCYTDDSAGLDPRIDARNLPGPWNGVKTAWGNAYPSCYRRLWLFSEKACEHFDGPVVNIDVDVVITGNIDHLFDRDEDFVGWCDPDMKGIGYSGGLWMLKPGTRTQVFNDFDPLKSPKATKKLGLIGSDQAWITHCLYPNESAWSREDGIVRTRNLEPGMDHCLIQTPSQFKPWSKNFELRNRDLFRIWREAAQRPDKPSETPGGETADVYPGVEYK